MSRSIVDMMEDMREIDLPKVTIGRETWSAHRYFELLDRMTNKSIDKMPERDLPRSPNYGYGRASYTHRLKQAKKYFKEAREFRHIGSPDINLAIQYYSRESGRAHLPSQWSGDVDMDRVSTYLRIKYGYSCVVCGEIEGIGDRCSSTHNLCHKHEIKRLKLSCKYGKETAMEMLLCKEIVSFASKKFIDKGK